jgi:monoamine oxidase
MGGQWIGRRHSELLRVVDELGLLTFPTHDEGQGFTVLDGQRHAWSEDGLGLPPDTQAEIERLHGLIADLAGGIPLEMPWVAAGAVESDRETVESWLRETTTDPIARRYVRVLTSAVFAAETHQVPLLHFVFYCASGGSLDELISTADGAQELRVVGGSHRIAERLAEELPASSLFLDAPVDAIRQDGDSVRVSFDGNAVVARRLIITLPPALAGRLRYEPALPSERDALTQAFPMGNVIKFQVLYDEPWWRADGLSGQSVSFDDPIATTFDNSPPDGGCGVLLAFAEGDHARHLARLAPSERQRLVVDCLARFFGPRAQEATEYAELDWSTEPFTRGCYGGRPGAGVWTSFGPALREPVGRIHWAGSETADVSCGYMDGAVRSGQRAAAEVRASLA